ncbi:chitin synthase chs-2-like [Ranitomeya variabilis]|uniref:chitin synthase chs-2-like n=1 Tax=Ranitomeya variabilis TaxID=490064 RepID=UPI004056DB30
MEASFSTETGENSNTMTDVTNHSIEDRDKFNRSWDPFMIQPVDDGEEKTGRCTTLLIYLFCFTIGLIVFASAFFSKACLLLLILVNGDSSKIVSNTPLKIIVLGLVIQVPYILTLIKCLWMVIFTHSPNPNKVKILKVCAVDFLVALGSSLLIIVAMPHFNIFTNITILSSVHLASSILQIYRGFRKKNWKWVMAIISVLLCISGHAVFLVMFIVRDTNTRNIDFEFVTMAVIGTFCVSWNWYRKFLPQKNTLNELKLDEDERNVLYMCGSIVRITVTWLVIIPYVWSHGGDVWTTIKSASSKDQNLLFALFGIQAVSSVLCHWFGVMTCKMRNVKLGFYIPLTLSVLSLIIAIISIFYIKYREVQSESEALVQTFNASYFCQNTLLINNKTLIDSLLLEITQQTCEIVLNIDTAKYVIASGILWYVGSICANFQVWRLKVQRIERTTQLLIRHLFEATFIDQSMLLNLRTKLNKNTFDDVDRSKEKVMVYLCATMWHETYDEMLKILTSIFRLDKYKSTTSDDTFDFEAHIYFDDAFDNKSEPDDNKRKRIANSYVECLVTVIEEVYRVFTRNKNQVFHHRNTSECKIQAIMPTPYGGRLCYNLPCGNMLYVHLKDKQRIRHKKRWSQIMYMYYLLGWKLYRKYAELVEKNPEKKPTIEEKLLKAKSNTYILALDGDTDFQPSSLMLLVDRLRIYPEVGAACGRIHPTGMGPMVWYQKFEYAVGHWLQKSSEHVFGSVLCSPGCFSLFRASAIMDDNVLKTYSIKANTAMEYVQYDQGEDRWLCTLLLQQGWRVEYNAASDAYTNAPQVFHEFYNQRRRWSPSTLANTLDLLHNGKQTSKKNPSISYFYVLYQILTMASSILSPATVSLMIAGSLSFLFQWDANGSIVFAIIPPALYILVCFITKPSTQINIAAILSICYAFLMMATFLSIIADIIKQQTFMTPTGLFLISMGIIYVITALLHPQEFFLLIYGLLYIICVPSGYLLLTIYSLVNMHIVSWGTRETVAPKEKKKQKTKKVKCQKNCKCLCWHIDVQVYDSKCDDQEKKSDIIEDQIDNMDAKRELYENECEIKENQVTHEEDWISQLQLKASYSKLKEEKLEEEEEPFWEGVIQQHLKPINEDEKKQAMIQSELKSLRNKVTFVIFMINLLWIVATFFLQMIGSSVHIVLPKVYVNGSHSSTEKLYVDPIGFMFLLSFAILLLLQFSALLYHRIFTFIHFIAYKNKKARKNRKRVRVLSAKTTDSTLKRMSE